MGCGEAASMTNSLHLFEVSERSERCELCNAPMPRAPQGTRSASVGRGAGPALGVPHAGRPPHEPHPVVPHAGRPPHNLHNVPVTRP